MPKKSPKSGDEKIHIKRDNNTMLVDIQYVQKNAAKGYEDCLYIITKDITTGEKTVTPVETPKVPIYVEKEEFRNHNYVKEYGVKSETDMKIVNYRDIPYAVANEMGEDGKRFLQNIRETKDYRKMTHLNLFPYVFGQDFDVRTIYRYSWLKSMDNKMPVKLRKSFLDIECDSLVSPGMPRMAKDPIDLVSVADDEKKIMYTFVLVGRDMPNLSEAELSKLQYTKEELEEFFRQRKEQEEELIQNPQVLIDRFHKEFDETYPGYEYKLYFYTDEAKLLVHLFQCIHGISPDFLQIWNISFDIPYIMGRMQALGLNPEEVMCEKEFVNKVCRFHRDTHNFEIKNKSDHLEISSKTVYVDQMELYAAIRKGGDELRSYKLDYVAKRECGGNGKYIYSGSAKTLKTLGYVDLLTYIVYNVKDVLLQTGIEAVTLDIDNLYQRCYTNISPYEYCFMQTVVLRNVQYKSYDKQGFVPGANANKILVQIDMEQHPEKYAGKKKPGFEGALVGNTRLINRFGQKLYGKRTNFIFKYSIDMDEKKTDCPCKTFLTAGKCQTNLNILQLKNAG
jgi:hypothetical protein